MAKQKTTFSAMPGGVLSKSMAKIAGKEMLRIQKNNGCIKPEILVEESRSTNAPLHNCFTWNDSIAAESWRVDEARKIIRSVRIIREDVPTEEQHVIRAFLNVTACEKETSFGGKAYLSLSKIQSSDEYKEQVLSTAKNELAQWQQRYADYKDYFSSIFAAIEELELA